MNNESIDFNKFLPEQTYNPLLHNRSKEKSSTLSIEDSQVIIKVALPTPNAFFHDPMRKNRIKALRVELRAENLFFYGCIFTIALPVIAFLFELLLIFFIGKGILSALEDDFIINLLMASGLFLALNLVLGVYCAKKNSAVLKPLREFVYNEVEKTSPAAGAFLRKDDIYFALIALINNPKGSEVFHGEGNYAGFKLELSLEEPTNSLVVAVKDTRMAERLAMEKLFQK